MIDHLNISLGHGDIQGKILHITDTHLFANDSDLLLGVSTNHSFQAVIDEIKQQSLEFDLIVATGDLAQDGSHKAYARFAQIIKQLSAPCVWLPGNHDAYIKMQSVLELYDLPEKKMILFGEHWLIILLNSQVVGSAYGCLNDTELAFLADTLASYPQRHVVAFLHHHPIMSHCDWLDEHGLKNSKRLADIIKQFSNLKAIGWGHIHQSIEKIWHNCQVFSTPSTCVQFKPQCQNFALSNDGPAWRVIDLIANGEIISITNTLKYNPFIADISQLGY